MAAVVNQRVIRKARQRNGWWTLTVVNDLDDGTDIVISRRLPPSLTEAAVDLQVAGFANKALAAKDKEETQAFINHIRDGGDPTAFVHNWSDQAVARRSLLRRFIRGRFVDDERLMIALATFIDGLTTIQLRNAANISNATAQKIKTRANRIVTTLAPAYDLDEVDVITEKENL